jgi:glutamate-1-semialdehyde aminotransferase
MEVKRNFEPKNNFLEKIRNLTRKKGIILIFDECTTGFRECYGGIYKKYNVIPDMVMFGKALGNGYAITSIVGIEDIMKSSKKTFISSTFWTERSGPTAALKTLEIMENIRSWEIICKKGKILKKKIKELADRFSLKIYFNSIESIVVFNFISKNNNFYIKYIIKEMLKKNILASNAIYLSIKHDDKIFNLYLKNLKKIFFQISKFENGLDISKFVAVNEEIISFSRVN